MKDIAPELLEKLQLEFKNKYENSKKITKLNNLLKDKKVTHKESHELAIEVGNILAEVFKENLSSDILPDGKLYYNIAERIINPTMKENFDLISDYSTEVQSVLNGKAKMKIKGKPPDLNKSKIDGIIERVSKEDNFDDIKWILDEPIVNFSQSIVDDTIKTNIEFHYGLGLKPKIVRKSNGNCCEWCNNLAGSYNYPDEVPKDVYRRHRFCKCETDYHPGDGKMQNVHTKQWSDSYKSVKIEKRKEVQAIPRILHKEDIPTENFIRGSGKNYPIKFVGSDHVKFDAGKIEKVTVIAGDGVETIIRDTPRLESFYKQSQKRWQKISGVTNIKYKGKTLKTEIHWYEANGQRKEIKIKKVIEDES